MHGVARVLVKDYAEQRYSELLRTREVVATRTTDGSGLRALARDMAEMGLGGLVVQGNSPDGPVH